MRALAVVLLLVMAGCVAPEDVRDEVRDSVVDPWRWLETGVDDLQVRSWLESRHDVAGRWFESAAHSGESRAVRDALQARWRQGRMNVPRRYGDQMFFFFNPGTEDHYTFYRLPVDRDGAGAPLCGEAGPCNALPVGAVSLLDPADWPEGDLLEQVVISPDGRYFVYRRYKSSMGSSVWFLGSASTPTIAHQPIDLPDASQFHWHPGGTSLYVLGKEPHCHLYIIGLEDQGVREGRDCLGLQGEGKPVALRGVTAKGSLLVDRLNGLEHTLVLVSGVTEEGHEADTLLLETEADWFRFIGENGERLYFLNYRDSWHGEVVSVHVDGDRQYWRTEVAQGDARLHHALVTTDGLLLEYLEHAASSLYFQDFRTGSREVVELPTYGRVADMVSREPGDAVYLKFDGMSQAPLILRFDPGSTALETIWGAPHPATGTALTVQRHFAGPADEGARPAVIYIAGREDVLGTGLHPLLLEAYGGFAIPVDIGYSISRAAWMDGGGLYAIAAVRGGGEYDAAWYQQGSGLHRQRSVDDLLMAADYLVTAGFTDVERLAVGGRSHGATLAASAATQAAGNFSALVVVAGVMDLLRYPIGGEGMSWLDEYGDPADPAAARVLRAISPYHRVLDQENVCHPPTLVAAAPDDPVVSAWHSYKYVAALEQKGPGQVLLVESVEQAHRETGSVAALIDDYARRWVFLRHFLIDESNSAGCP